MGSLYLDETLDFTDPATTDRRYLREDNQWVKADSDHRFLDQTDDWNVPELGSSIPADIADASWAGIVALADLAAADPDSYASYVGQTKRFAMPGVMKGPEVTVRVIGVGQDYTPEGARTGLTLQIVDGLEDVASDGSRSDDAVGPWRDSWMRNTYMPKLIAALPEELRPHLKEVRKYTSDRMHRGSLVETSDRMFTLSIVEQLGKWEVLYDPDGEDGTEKGNVTIGTDTTIGNYFSLGNDYLQGFDSGQGVGASHDGQYAYYDQIMPPASDPNNYEFIVGIPNDGTLPDESTFSWSRCVDDADPGRPFALSTTTDRRTAWSDSRGGYLDFPWVRVQRDDTVYIEIDGNPHRLPANPAFCLGVAP